MSCCFQTHIHSNALFPSLNRTCWTKRTLIKIDTRSHRGTHIQNLQSQFVGSSTSSFGVIVISFSSHHHIHGFWTLCLYTFFNFAVSGESLVLVSSIWGVTCLISHKWNKWNVCSVGESAISFSQLLKCPPFAEICVSSSYFLTWLILSISVENLTTLSLIHSLSSILIIRTQHVILVSDLQTLFSRFLRIIMKEWEKKMQVILQNLRETKWRWDSSLVHLNLTPSLFFRF